MTVPPDVVVVVPTYNERENITGLVGAVRSHGYRVLIVDDQSPDGSGEVADGIAARDPAVSVLHRSAKRGLGAAYGHGFEVALASGPGVVCQMDADFSHDPADLPRLVAVVSEGAHVALGSRYVPGGSTPDWPLSRKLISRLGNLYARSVLGLRVHDATGGFRAYKADVLASLEAQTAEASGYAFQVEMARRASEAGFEIVEVPITFRDRRYGQSKMNGRIVREAMWLVSRWGWERFVRKLPWRS